MDRGVFCCPLAVSVARGVGGGPPPGGPIRVSLGRVREILQIPKPATPVSQMDRFNFPAFSLPPPPYFPVSSPLPPPPSTRVGGGIYGKLVEHSAGQPCQYRLQ